MHLRIHAANIPYPTLTLVGGRRRNPIPSRVVDSRNSSSGLGLNRKSIEIVRDPIVRSWINYGLGFSSAFRGSCHFEYIMELTRKSRENVSFVDIHAINRIIMECLNNAPQF